MTDNYWPDLDTKIKTDCVFEFIKTLREQIKEKYNNKIDCSLEEIVYKNYGISGLHKSMCSIKTTLGPEEEQSIVEKNKKEVSVKAFKEYKFILFNDKFFFRVFDMRFGEFFPIGIRPVEELGDVFVQEFQEYYSEETFKSKIISLINTKTVKDVISYMKGI